ncbi:phytanoyl-CoA dioxygenase family protein [Paraburkholderia rhizosphaerae]|uniref:Ectoine hydroxylase-related dioxygenase (Phytanoyl-CoA dioxygenase family) n=1 Tax=Paraburkholderia rhizosphaerae TaxID=480658 RepID=A0A4R8LUY8_9BURK|nr:phytanoyl-CoA dioxygenase family protein [Paraburkholderia rhizosphaerae]TDY51610.1 ectoine hydroxylase-related dioxygenase (phytanoyl-CoA dioxygenase family) [Paraburkholderia rhizosphaerae]
MRGDDRYAPAAQPPTTRHDSYREDHCSVADFAGQIAAGTYAQQTQLAASTPHGIPLYDCDALRDALENSAARAQLQAEWVHVLREGAGVMVLRHAYDDTVPIDEATALFEDVIREERAQGGAGGDHFAKAGANDRIWNALEKLCLRAPELFARYYANGFVAAAADAWLGPHYQMTSQINVVRPGGAAQQAHRDYHLGFQTVAEAQRYPAHVHTMSPFLTLQGAIAHVDMPVESGPTKLLPYSQRYAPGYVAWRRDDFRRYFEAHCVQLPLAKGDALFFNPALFHAAGENRTADVARMANLLQISSAYGRAMESVDRSAMCEALYPALCDCVAHARLKAAQLDAVIASCAEGYPFPTNLDRDPPLGGLAPPSQQTLLKEALAEAWPAQKFIAALRQHAWRRETGAVEAARR